MKCSALPKAESGVRPGPNQVCEDDGSAWPAIDRVLRAGAHSMMEGRITSERPDSPGPKLATMSGWSGPIQGLMAMATLK